MRLLLIYSLVFVCMANSTAFAGIESLLVEHRSNQCIIRITHDATPESATGTLVIRSFKRNQNMLEPCPPEKRDITESVYRSLSIAQTKKLKPVDAMFIGRIVRYPWIEKRLVADSKLTDSVKKKSSKELGSKLIEAGLITPFTANIETLDYRSGPVECEKILYYSNGAVEDALCYIVLKRAK